MGEVLNNGVYLPDRGERNAYDGLKGNWNTLDSIAGKVPGYDAHISDTDIHVTAADKQTWNGKADASHVHNANDVTTGVFDAARIPNLDASKITTGTIDIDRLPQGALERLVKVADQAARYALTASDVQLGDTVQQLDTGVMYVVTDETKLDSADGYTEYTAGSATSVPWSGVTGKPADYPPASHSHGNITNDGKVGTTANKPLITGTGGVVQAGSFGNTANTFCEGNDSRLSDARTPVAHTHSKADITNLFNSDFIPSSDANYALGSSDLRWRQIWCSGYKTKAPNIDFTNSTTTGTKESWWVDTTEKNGTGFFGVGSVRVHSSGINREHFRIKNAGGKWADLYIQLTDDNQFSIGTANHSDVTNIGFRGKFVPLGSFIPYVNNSYDLGSSSYQWNNLYAKNYYYNGVAWGLDKSNVWTQNQTISINLPVFTLQDTIGVRSETPTGNRQFVLSFLDKNGDSYGFINRQHRSGTGTHLHQVSINNGTYDYRLQFYLYNDGTSAFIPSNNGVINLGVSTNKWKSINGINPGALSLPDYTLANVDLIDVSQWSVSGQRNDYTPDSDGWLFVHIKDTASNSVFIYAHSLYNSADPTKSTDYSASCFGNGSQGAAGRIAVMIPVRAGVVYGIFIKAASVSDIFSAKFYPALGNV